MRRSSRLWWLHGVVLVSAAIGCKNCGSSGGSCGGPPPGGGSPYGGGSPILSAGPTAYSQTPPTSSSYPGMSGAPTGSSSYSPSSAGYGMGMPNTSSSLSSGLVPNR